MPYTTRSSLSITEKFRGGGVGRKGAEWSGDTQATHPASLTATHCYRCDDTNRFTNGHFCCPRGNNFLCVADFPKVKLPRGNFHGYVKKNKRITHDSSRPRKFYGLIRTQSGSTNHEKVKYTKQSRSCVVYLLRSSWRQILRETGLKVGNHISIFSSAVNVFMFNIFSQSTLKQWKVFFSFLIVFKNSYLMKSKLFPQVELWEKGLT